MKKPVTPLALSMLSTAGGTIFAMGVYLAALARGLSQPQSLACAFFVNGLLALKWALRDAKALGAPKGGALVWAALFGALALAGLQ